MWKAVLLAAVIVGGVMLAGLVIGSVSGESDTSTITVKQSNVAPGGPGCVDGEWHLIINQIASPSLAPDEVDVTFSDGHTHDYDLSKFTGKVAHYSIFDHLTDTLVTATANIYDGWQGQFVVSHAPCTVPCEEEPCDTPTPTPTPSATSTPTLTPSPIPTATPPGGTTPTPTITPTVSAALTLEMPSALPDTGGEGSDGGGIGWLSVFMVLVGIFGVMFGTIIIVGAVREWWENDK